MPLPIVPAPTTPTFLISMCILPVSQIDRRDRKPCLVAAGEHRGAFHHLARRRRCESGNRAAEPKASSMMVPSTVRARREWGGWRRRRGFPPFLQRRARPAIRLLRHPSSMLLGRLDVAEHQQECHVVRGLQRTGEEERPRETARAEKIAAEGRPERGGETARNRGDTGGRGPFGRRDDRHDI